MKKIIKISLVLMIAVCFVTVGCGCAEIREENVAEEDVLDIRNEFEYYNYYSGSSSVSESFLIYKYNDNLIFTAYYFNCGDSYSETYMLSEEQEEELYCLLETELKVCQEEEGEDDHDGAHMTEALFGMAGERIKVYPVDISNTDIRFMDASDMQLEELEMIPFESMNVIRESAMWRKIPFWIDTSAYCYMLEEQIKTQIGQDIIEMLPGDMGEEDYKLEVVTESGETIVLTVTYWGYVVE